MKIVMTGATGLIGGALGLKLAEEGHEVVALVRNVESARAHLPFECTLSLWDGEKTAPQPNVFDGASGLIHLAGENIATARWTDSRKAVLRNSRIQSAQRLAEAVGSKPLDFVIGASAIGIYGDRGDEWLNEQSKPGDDFLARLCQDWEKATDKIPSRRTIKARFGIVLSKHGGFIGQVTPMFKRFGASRLGSGSQWTSWIHLEDLVQILVRSVLSPTLKGVVNMVAPGPVTNQEMTAKVGHSLKAWPGPPVPKFALSLLYGELSSALMASQRVQSEFLKPSDFQFPDLDSALKEVFAGG